MRSERVSRSGKKNAMQKTEATRHAIQRHCTTQTRSRTQKKDMTLLHFISYRLLGPKPCKNCESRMSEANPRQSLVKGERLIRYELASAIVREEFLKLKGILERGRRSGRASLRCTKFSHVTHSMQRATLFSKTKTNENNTFTFYKNKGKKKKKKKKKKKNTPKKKGKQRQSAKSKKTTRTRLVRMGTS